MNISYRYIDPDGAVSPMEVGDREAAISQGNEWLKQRWVNLKGLSKTLAMVAYVEEIFPEGDVYRSNRLLRVHEPHGPRCTREVKEHEWTDPVSVVGGAKEQPGLKDLKGGRMIQTRVCSRCGIYRVIDNADPGVTDQPMESVAFHPPDTISLAWAGKRDMGVALMMCVERLGLDDTQKQIARILKHDRAELDLFSGTITVGNRKIKPHNMAMAHIVAKLDELT